MNKKTRIITLGVLAIMIVICISLGITRAFMKPLGETSSVTEVALSSCAKISLTDKNSINLSNTYPMSKNRALQTTPYTFTVSSSCETFVGFNLYLAVPSTNTLPASDIHYIITNVGSKEIIADGILSAATNATSSFIAQEKTEYEVGMGGSISAIYQIFNASIPYQGETSYDLYLYLDENATQTTNGSKTFTAAVAVKAYDREASLINLAQYIVKLHNGIDGNNDIYLHDGVGNYSNSTYEANDGSYRYSGSDPDNYVCFGSNVSVCPDDNLYRIIGVFKEKDIETGNIEQRVKLIKADYANETLLGADGDRQKGYGYSKSKNASYKGNLNFVNSYYWNYISTNSTKNEWEESKLNSINLNTNMLNYIGTNWNDLIATSIWHTKGISTSATAVSSGAKSAYLAENENGAVDEIYNSKIGLLYLNEYYYAASPNYWSYAGFKNGNDSIDDYTSAKDDNWMFLGLYDYFISTAGWNAVSVFRLSSAGNMSWTQGYNPGAIRPTFYLKSDVILESGTGTKDNPFRLENKKEATKIKTEIASYSRNETTLTLNPKFSLGANALATVYYQINNDGVWHESSDKSIGYSFSGLIKNTTYNIKIRSVDANGVFSNISNYNLTTYLYPTVTLASSTKTANSITVNVTGTNGTKNIGKYMYSIDNGSTWVTNSSTATSNSYTFTGLTSATAYTIKIRIVDSNGSYSQNNDITTTITTD